MQGACQTRPDPPGGKGLIEHLTCKYFPGKGRVAAGGGGTRRSEGTATSRKG